MLSDACLVDLFTSNNEHINSLSQMSISYDKLLGDRRTVGHFTKIPLNTIREPVWNYLRQTCGSFIAMNCSAPFSEIFRKNVFVDLNDEETNRTISEYLSIGFCSGCKQNVTSRILRFL